MQNDFWLGVIWWGCVAGLLTSKVIDKNWSFVVSFIVIFFAVLIYKRYNERRHK